MNGEEFCNIINRTISKALFRGKDGIDNTQDHVNKLVVLLELTIYIAQQNKLPKSKKSNFFNDGSSRETASCP